MTRVTAALLAGAALLTAAPAYAADVYQSAPPVAAAPYVPPSGSFDWSGPYAGAIVGYAFGEHQAQGFGDDDDFSSDGFSAGVMAGQNWQFDNVVVGVEGDVNYAGVDGNGSLAGRNVDIDTKAYGTLRARAGYAFDNLLAYGTGGIAVSHSRGVVDGFSDRSTDIGFAVGAGLEAAVTNDITVRGEYLYVDTGTASFNETNADFSAHTVRLGAAYHF
jgi:outer membrane immunogenic protein